MTQQRFKSKIGGWPMVILLIIIITIGSITLLDLIVNGFYFQKIWVLIIDSTLVLLAFWMLLDTYYKLDDQFLYYQSGPIKGRIRLSKITSIDEGHFELKYFPQGMCNNGIIIKTKNENSFYITPVNESKLVEEIKKYSSKN